MSDLQTGVQLLLAVVELAQVQSITRAITANTLRKGGHIGPLGNIDNPKPVHGSFGVNLEPRYDQRRVIHPSPRYETRIVHTRTVERPALIDAKQPAPPAETAQPIRHKSPLAPPWELPLPSVQAPVIRVVKYEAHKPDLICKGMLIDLFI